MMNCTFARTGAEVVEIAVDNNTTIKQALNLEGTGPLFGGEFDESAADAKGDVTGLDFRMNGTPATLSTVLVPDAIVLIIPKVEGGSR